MNSRSCYSFCFWNSCYIDEKVRRLCEISFNSSLFSAHKYSLQKKFWQYFITLPSCYLAPPTAVQQKVTISFHFNRSLAISGSWYQNISLLCRSSFTVAKSSLVYFHVSFHNRVSSPWQSFLVGSQWGTRCNQLTECACLPPVT